MTQKKYDVSVVIGRFQPAHEAHIKVFEQALDISDNLIIVIGTANAASTPKNPFTSQQRENLIKSCFNNETLSRIKFIHVEDSTYNMNKWLESIQEQVRSTIAQFMMPWKDKGADIVLVGHTKDKSSFYLNEFPQWDQYEVENIDDINSTQIRRDMFNNRFVSLKIPKPIRRGLIDWLDTAEYEYLLQEFNFIEKYRDSWKVAPYPNNFMTSDAIVIQSGHVLLIKRRASPGKGLWALPGGHVDQEETLEEAMVRELIEETRLKVQDKVIAKSITKREMIDNPFRSSRGRTFTMAFLVELEAGKLNNIRAGSDASAAKWIPLEKVKTMRSEMFEDHLDIILKMIGDR